jgi:predicted 3-demethylubiquinone-9 3-methyltransferase (glyoxalase superfamily)
MQKITTFLTFDGRAEEAIELYTSTFGGEVLSSSRWGAGGPLPEGTLMSAELELAGMRLMILNAGPQFSFAQGFSLYVDCEDQAEVDRYWDRLVASGGTPTMCGWLTDKFGLSWQIIPKALPRLMRDPDRAKAGRVIAAMMQMQKIDVAALERAYEG